MQMVDKSGLQLVGWLFGGTTAAVMLVAALLVSEALASNHPAAEQAAQSAYGQLP
jgi:hypothetical protein